MKFKLVFLTFCLGCKVILAHADPHDVIHALTHQLEHAEKKDKAELYFKRAAEYRASGKLAKAKSDLLTFTKLKPNDHNGWLELSRGEEEDDDRFLYLTKSFDLAVTDRERAMSHFGLAKHYYVISDYQNSLRNCESAIKIEHKKQIAPLLLKSHLLWKLGELDKRVEFLTDAKKVNPSIVLENNWIEAMIDADKGVELKGLIEKGIQESRFKSSWQIRAALCAPDHSEEAKVLAIRAITEINKRLDMKRPDITLLMDLARAFAIIEEYEKSLAYLKLVKAGPHDLWTMNELESKTQDPR